MNKPSIPKGTRDFSPIEMAKRNYIFETIKNVYALYGFQQIETPSLETLQTLMGKYGEEGDKLLFKILNSGDFMKTLKDKDLQTMSLPQIATEICEKGLRYDLTVPFARYVVMHKDELKLPFKRYQIQPVWRADRPQKGRYREFYQCDADIVGSDSLLNEVELLQIIDTVFTRLGIKVIIKINNRKILAGIAEYIRRADKIIDITVAMDKLDKIGLEGVNEELRKAELSEEEILKLQPIISLKGTLEQKTSAIAQVLKAYEVGLKGIEEINQIFEMIKHLNLQNTVELDLTLARGLNYYTGTIIEVKAVDVAIGSITGGGRYDDLTGIFGLPGISGVGISFGADRIYDVLQTLELFPTGLSTQTQVMCLNLGKEQLMHALEIVKDIRNQGISTELFPDALKMKKQMAYANAKNIALVLIAGEEEIQNETCTLKNMQTGQQKIVKRTELTQAVKEELKQLLTNDN